MNSKSNQSKYNCPKCGNVYSTSSNLNKHIKNCKNDNCSVSSTEEVSNTFNTSSMMELISQLPQIIQKNKELEEEIKRLKNELQHKNLEITNLIEYDPPYNKEQFAQAIYKYNPFTTQYAIRYGGFKPKDYKSWYVPNLFNANEYPDRTEFYKKCLTNILNNIPIDKLPYKIRDASRYSYDVYNYRENMWVKGKTKELIQLIKLLIMYIHSSLLSAFNVLSELTVYDFKIIDKRNLNPIIFNDLRRNLQIELTDRYCLPEYDGSDEDEIINFYKRNFIKILTDRLKGDEVDDSDLEELIVEPRIMDERKMYKNVPIDDEYDSDEGYKTDSDPYYE